MTSKIDFTNEQEIAKAQEQMAGEASFTMSLDSCPHCGGHHEDLEWRRLKTSVQEANGRIITHVGFCPASELQLRLSFLPSPVVAQRERAEQIAQAGNNLHIDGMGRAEIDKVLNALREQKQ